MPKYRLLLFYGSEPESWPYETDEPIGVGSEVTVGGGRWRLVAEHWTMDEHDQPKLEPNAFDCERVE